MTSLTTSSQRNTSTTRISGYNALDSTTGGQPTAMEFPVAVKHYRSNAFFIFNESFSLQLLKNAVSAELGDLFSFNNPREIITFITQKPRLVHLLQDLHTEIIRTFGLTNFELELELMIESSEWKTLFINIHNDLEIEDALDKIYHLQDWIITNFPGDYHHINISNNLLIDAV